MSMASDLYHDMMVENEYDYYDQYERSHLAYSGYVYMEGWWERTFEDKVVVARKDYPKFGIKKGEKHRFIKTKYIEAETGCSSWEVEREPLNKVVKANPVNPAPVSWGGSWGFNSTESSWTGSWTQKDK